MRDKSGPEYTTDVVIVGAGPTGLALCAQLLLFGVRSRVIDRALDRAHESRALAVQARTLELFQALDVADELVSRGNKSAKLMLHLDGRVVAQRNSPASQPSIRASHLSCSFHKLKPKRSLASTSHRKA